MKHTTYIKDISGTTVTAHLTDLAGQANGSIMLSANGTVVLAAITMGDDTHKNPGYFNLTVEYTERFYASGKIAGGPYQRREGRPSLNATLASRIIDRTLRPLFDSRIKNSVQIIVTVLSVGDYDPVVLATNAASMALHISDIPWNGPIGCARSGVLLNSNSQEISINPYQPNMSITPFLSADLLVCGNGTAVNMIEMGSAEVSPELFDQLLDTTVSITAQWTSWITELRTTVGKTKKVIEFPVFSQKLSDIYETRMRLIIERDLFGTDSKSRIGQIFTTWKEIIEEERKEYKKVTEENPQIEKESDPFHNSSDFLDHKIDEVLHTAALQDKKRADGRKMDEVRPLYAQAGGISDRLHGSGIFYRGETHVLSVATLAGPDSNLMHESMDSAGEERFWHHYNFPPYSTGETGRIGSTGRRELGHGALAQKALEPVIPNVDLFPYTIRVVSECLSSNGSTSQASVCAATLALMDAGVPITRPVVGISIGLMMDAVTSKYALLTDIQGPEDHHGDMDFKVAGTSAGITAIQMDIKLASIPVSVCREAVRAARVAHETLLKTITDAISVPRPILSPYAPRIEILQIDPEKIGLVIGGGGKTIQKIQKDTKTTISIEDDGRIFITGHPEKGLAETSQSFSGPSAARKIIEDMTHEWVVGERVTAVVVKIIDETGAIVEWGNTSGMIHISEISKDRVSRVSDKLSQGQSVEAIIVSVDKERDRIGLSMKRLSGTA